MERSDPANPMVVWTSTLKRTIETAQYIPAAKVQLRALDEIDAGEFDGWTYAEIEKKGKCGHLINISLINLVILLPPLTCP